MGQRGPKGRPLAVKILEGNRNKEKLPDGFIEVDAPLERPEGMNKAADEVFDNVIGAMPPGVYTAGDRELILTYCMACSNLREARQNLEIQGQVLETEYGLKRNPWGVVAREAIAQIATIGSRLGLDPMARQNIAAPEKKAKSKFEGLIPINGGKAKQSAG
jgi:P27 family predicted phage terminase small subunit